MKVAHFSDVHGQLDNLSFPLDVQGLVCTGDFFPNSTRGIRQVEVDFQTTWFERNQEKIFRVFGGLPIVCVDGNHDFVSLGAFLLRAGYPGLVVNVNPYEAQDFLGLKVAGYREIPWIAGEWNGETYAPELHGLADCALQTGCEILLTHTPPKGILSGDYGCSSLSNLLAYSQHNVRFHFFGHCHDGHGTVENMGIQFSNAATAINLIDINA
jgi:Icc-related predicted phosphoesterase